MFKKSQITLKELNDKFEDLRSKILQEFPDLSEDLVVIAVQKELKLYLLEQQK